MSDVIKIKKGLDLPLTGAAAPTIGDATNIRRYAVKPTDFVGLMPKLLVQEGDLVKTGSPLFCEKKDTRICFTSPVNGKVSAVVRGDKRALLAVVVETSDAESNEEKLSLQLSDAESIKNAMLQTGLWTALRQRPFGTVANPDSQPKAIFVSAFDSAPLAPDTDFVLKGREKEFAKGLELLAMLTKGKLHVSFRPGQALAKAAQGISNVVCHTFSGPHPAGLVGTQIAAIDPINKGEIVWFMNPQDVAVLGNLALTGIYRPERVIAVAGPQVKNPQYYRIIAGASMEEITKATKLDLNTEGNGFRYISGNVLSGTRIAHDGFIGAYDSLLSILAEGDHYDFMGWLAPGFKKFSFSRTFLSGFSARCKCSQKAKQGNGPKFDTNLHGGVRPFIFTGAFEQVFPMDIYPLQLIKACIVGDIELMENLGIYEVEPEDFALCEFVDVSKTEIQSIVRQALEQLRKEAM
ncbi:MAG: Na(+)-translocating NADH-quinone reductase subunit A [Bacteroidales bacterium]|nr:Na(+)-translocating NADH-quinone reductase subunit A [Bacteroidales bacterium]